MMHWQQPLRNLTYVSRCYKSNNIPLGVFLCPYLVFFVLDNKTGCINDYVECVEMYKKVLFITNKVRKFLTENLYKELTQRRGKWIDLKKNNMKVQAAKVKNMNYFFFNMFRSLK